MGHMKSLNGSVQIRTFFEKYMYIYKPVEQLLWLLTCRRAIEMMYIAYIFLPSSSPLSLPCLPPPPSSSSYGPIMHEKKF